MMWKIITVLIYILMIIVFIYKMFRICDFKDEKVGILICSILGFLFFLSILLGMLLAWGLI